jgi:ABC-2 type transport system ATP-binding protein
VIEVEKLTKRYGDRVAVRDMSFAVEKGEVVGFLGPNGAGKSTTLRMITGFLAPTSGRVVLDGIDVARRPLEARKRFGYMPEGVPLYPEMRVLEYLRYRAELKGIAFRKAKSAAERSLEVAGVLDARDRIIGQLSKGYRQRVGIADALVADPPILILDEPTSGLDPNQNRHIRSVIRSFEGEKTVFVSTHILPEVEATCARAVIIRAGEKVSEGRIEELRVASTGAQVLKLAGPGSFERFLEVLVDIPVVRRCVHEPIGYRDGDSTARFLLEVEPGDAAVDVVFRSITDAGLTLRELRRDGATLEDVFADLTTEEHEEDGTTMDALGEASATPPADRPGEADMQEDKKEERP